jgi:phage gp36-like protein
MPYNDQSDILGEISNETLIQLTDDENLGVVDDAKVTQALTRADAEVDGYCGKRYQVPFAPVPDFVKALALDIAVYNLFSRRENVPENRQRRRDAAVKNLELISKGVVTLGLQEPAPAATFSSAEPEVISGGDRQFSRQSLKGY